MKADCGLSPSGPYTCPFNIFASQVPHIALRQPKLGFRPAFSANSRIDRSSLASHIAVTLLFVKTTRASWISSISAMSQDQTAHSGGYDVFTAWYFANVRNFRLEMILSVESAYSRDCRRTSTDDGRLHSPMQDRLTKPRSDPGSSKKMRGACSLIHWRPDPAVEHRSCLPDFHSSNSRVSWVDRRS